MSKHLVSFNQTNNKEFKINFPRRLSITRCTKIPQTHENLTFKHVIYIIKKNLQYVFSQPPDSFSDEVPLNLKLKMILLLI